MADTINDTKLQNIYTANENGYFIRIAQEAMVMGYDIAGLFPFRSVPSTKATIADDKPIDQFLDQFSKEKSKVAKESGIRFIRGTTISPEGLKLEELQLGYKIVNEDMLDPAFDLVKEIQSMGYLFSDFVNTHIIETIRKNAIEVDGLKGKWDDPTTEFKSMTRDVMAIQDVMAEKPYNIDLLALGRSANFELKTKATESTVEYTVPKTDFKLKSVLPIVDTNCFSGGKGMEAGEVFGFDSNQKPLDIIFKEYANPNVQKMPVPEGMQKLAPPLGMLMYSSDQTDLNATTTIKMGCSVGVHPHNKGSLMVKSKKSVVG